MKTFKINIKNEIDEKVIDKAVEILKDGGVVAFPTETVYGLGADALNERAVDKIFKAKGRPQDNPLIVHVSSKNIKDYVEEVPDKARVLMDKFWPGPLTIILSKKDIIPNKTSANLNTVGVRMPDNIIARKIIEKLGRPVAAPSANISGRPSPTTYERCVEDLDGKVDMIIGYGESDVGIESTIIDYTDFPPAILRPGKITFEEIKILDDNVVFSNEGSQYIDNKKPKAPGMKYRHYAPKAPIILVLGEKSHKEKKINELISLYLKENKKIGVLGSTSLGRALKEIKKVTFLSLGEYNSEYNIARNLFENLRKFDDENMEIIIAEGYKEKGIYAAVMNRLKKAASYNIIEV